MVDRALQGRPSLFVLSVQDGAVIREELNDGIEPFGRGSMKGRIAGRVGRVGRADVGAKLDQHPHDFERGGFITRRKNG